MRLGGRGGGSGDSGRLDGAYAGMGGPGDRLTDEPAEDGVTRGPPPMSTGANTLLSLAWCAVGVSGVDGVVGVLPRVAPSRMLAGACSWLAERCSLDESSLPEAALRRWFDAKIADMEGSGCGMCRLSSERGFTPGDLSFASGHFLAALMGCLHPRGSISRLSCRDTMKR